MPALKPSGAYVLRAIVTVLCGKRSRPPEEDEEDENGDAGGGYRDGDGRPGGRGGLRSRASARTRRRAAPPRKRVSPLEPAEVGSLARAMVDRALRRLADDDARHDRAALDRPA